MVAEGSRNWVNLTTHCCQHKGTSPFPFLFSCILSCIWLLALLHHFVLIWPLHELISLSKWIIFYIVAYLNHISEVSSEVRAISMWEEWRKKANGIGKNCSFCNSHNIFNIFNHRDIFWQLITKKHSLI